MATRPFWRSTVPGRFMLTVPVSSSSAVCSVHSPCRQPAMSRTGSAALQEAGYLLQGGSSCRHLR